MRSVLTRWLAVPAVALALTLPGGVVFAQGVDEGAVPESPWEVREQVAPAAEEVVPTSGMASFIFPVYTWIPGVGVEVDTGGPAVRIEYTAEDDR